MSIYLKIISFIANIFRYNRQETYFSLTSILVSIAIFSAGLLTVKKKGIEKRMIAKVLPFKKTICFSIVLIIAFWIEKNIAKSYTSNFVLTMEALFNIAILYSYALTICLMVETVKLTSDDIYYSNTLKKYIENQTEKAEKESFEIDKKYKVDDVIFSDKLKNTNCIIHNCGDFLFKDEYVGLLANFNGLVTDINKKGLPKRKMNSKEIGHDSILYIDNIIGRYIRKGEIVCYCNRQDEVLYRNTRKYYKINEDYYPYNRRFEEIIDCLFSNAKMANGVFDKDNNIKEYVIFLYDSKSKKAIDFLIVKITDYYYEIKNNEINLKYYYYFIRSIRQYALKYDDFVTYKALDDLIMNCYYLFIQADGSEDKAYDIKTSYSMQLYELKSKSGNYYDYTLSNFLKLIYYQIRDRRYGIIKQFIEENYTIFDRYEIKNEEIHIINLAFICGLVKGLLTKLSESNSNDVEEIEDVKKIFECISSEEHYHDGVELVERYRKISQLSPSVYQVSHNCEMYIENQKNGAKFSVYEVGDVDLLVNIINLFYCVVFIKQKYEPIEYKKEDKYFFEQLKNKVNNYQNDNSLIRNVLDYKMIEEYLSDAIAKCEKDEHEYIVSATINSEYYNLFLDEVRKEAYKKEDLLKILDEKSKIKYGDYDFDNKLSISCYLHRQLFFDYNAYKNLLVDPFRSIFTSAIIERYCTYINDNFPSYDSIEELDCVLFEDDDYLIFINNNLYYTKYFSVFSRGNTVSIKEKEIECYHESDDIVGIKAIKIGDLPTIYVDAQRNINDQEHVSDGIYAILYDLANDEEKRNEILKNSKNVNENLLLTKVLFNAMMNVKIDK